MKNKSNKLKSIAKNNFVQKIIETFATRIFLISIGLVTTVTISRLLGPEGRGVFAVAIAVTSIGVQFGNLGLHASNTYYVARDESILSQIIGNSLFVSLVIGSGVSLLFYLFFITFDSFSPIENKVVLFIAIASIPISLSYLLISNIFIGLQKVRIFNILEITNKFIVIISIGLVFLIFGISVEKFLLIVLLGNLAVLFLAQRRILFFIDKIKYSFLLFKKHIRYGLKAYLSAFFAFMVIRSDILIVDHFLGPAATGYYSIASSMAEMVYMLPAIIGMLLAPKVIKLTDVKKKWWLTKKTVWVTTGVMMLFCLLAFFLSEFAIKLLFGEEFLPSVPPFIYLIPAVFFLSIETVAVQYLASFEFPKSIVVVWFFVLLTNIGLGIILIKEYGLVGISISTSFSYFICFILILYLIRRKINEFTS